MSKRCRGERVSFIIGKEKGLLEGAGGIRKGLIFSYKREKKLWGRRGRRDKGPNPIW